jgi:hypothetical protein
VMILKVSRISFPQELTPYKASVTWYRSVVQHRN